MKTKTFFFKCATVHGIIILGVVCDVKSIKETGCTVEDFRRDLRNVLEPVETITETLTKKPSGLEWSTFRNVPWCIAGFSKVSGVTV